VVDSLRLEDGVMVEHWDVIQDARKFRRRSQLAKVLCYNF